MVETLAWLILFLPLFAAVAILLFTRRNDRLSAFLSIGAVVTSFIFSLVIVYILRTNTGVTPFFVNWLSVGELRVNFGVQFDTLSELMLLVVTGVGSAIHIYSFAYMHGDRSFWRFFACLSLFTFSMLGIVLATNFVQMFIFWELVGVSSYLLIGFWYERPAAADACKKAFITNRLGDFGFLLGIILVWSVAGGRSIGSLEFENLERHLATHFQAFAPVATIAGLLIFCGAMGKSAQFPLHVWLPDAMEGPTPVSALIHAATMVAAGVYMLCRVFFLFNPVALEVIAYIGGLTALLAALMAVQQNDIKRILAYSTLSQLGYMVMAVGLHGPTQGMYHLTTHAFFKALLFLGAGSVIHALHHEQDIWKMGGLTEKMPVTYKTFLIGTLALCGVPPLSGFYSKDSILALAVERENYGLFGVGVVVAFLTTFYMSRLVLVAFMGPARSHAPDHAHESPAVMRIPLVVLAVLSVAAGFFGLDRFIGRQFGNEGHALSLLDQFFAPFNHSPAAAFASLGAVVFGGGLAFGCYWNAAKDPLPEKLGVLARTMRDRFYFDEIYEKFVIRVQDCFAQFTDGFDRWIVDGLVKFSYGTIDLFGRALRMVQTGNLQTYAFLFVAGSALVLYFVLFR